MKVTWEESDIRGGIILISQKHGEKGIISFHAMGHLCTYAFVSMVDGGKTEEMDKKTLAEWLTKYAYIPQEFV